MVDEEELVKHRMPVHYPECLSAPWPFQPDGSVLVHAHRLSFNSFSAPSAPAPPGFLLLNALPLPLDCLPPIVLYPTGVVNDGRMVALESMGTVHLTAQQLLTLAACHVQLFAARAQVDEECRPWQVRHGAVSIDMVDVEPVHPKSGATVTDFQVSLPSEPQPLAVPVSRLPQAAELVAHLQCHVRHLPPTVCEPTSGSASAMTDTEGATDPTARVTGFGQPLHGFFKRFLIAPLHCTSAGTSHAASAQTLIDWSAVDQIVSMTVTPLDQLHPSLFRRHVQDTAAPGDQRQVHARRLSCVRNDWINCAFEPAL